jgi:DNA-binding GntR family transcriptional regulator
MTQPASPHIARGPTSDAVVAHIIDLLFSGALRSGDRIDLDALARDLDISRVPIREALAQLERDGLVRTRHHRGAFISAFGPGTIREAFELYALLSGLTSLRVAKRRDKTVLESLTTIESMLHDTHDLDRFEELAREFRRCVNLAASGPHFRALVRTFRGLVPAAARFGMARAMPREREYIAEELGAIRRGAGTVASRVAIEHIRYSGQCAIDGLIEAGVFMSDEDDEVSGDPAELLVILKSLGV